MNNDFSLSTTQISVIPAGKKVHTYGQKVYTYGHRFRRIYKQEVNDYSRYYENGAAVH